MQNQIILYISFILVGGLGLSACEISDDFVIDLDAELPNPNPNPNPTPNLTGGMISPQTGGSMLSGGALNPTGCQAEGQRLEVCSICDSTLMPVIPDTEPMCPFVNCDSLGTYATREVDNGGIVCEYFPYDVGNPICKALGECNTNPEEVCVPQITETLFTAYPGCGEYTGCEGNTAPTATLKAPGDPCNGFGECQDDGQCSVAAGCTTLDIIGSNEFCGVSDDNLCESLVVASSYQSIDKISCIAYCQRSRMECRNGWKSNGGCTKGEEVGCSVDQREIICQCAP